LFILGLNIPRVAAGVGEEVIVRTMKVDVAGTQSWLSLYPIVACPCNVENSAGTVVVAVAVATDSYTVVAVSLKA